MTTDARVLEHGFEDAEGLGMSMLVKITLKDGANATPSTASGATWLSR